MLIISFFENYTLILLLIHVLSSLGTTEASAPVSESSIPTSTIAAQGTRKSSILLLQFIQNQYRSGLFFVV